MYATPTKNRSCVPSFANTCFLCTTPCPASPRLTLISNALLRALIGQLASRPFVLSLVRSLVSPVFVVLLVRSLRTVRASYLVRSPDCPFVLSLVFKRVSSNSCSDLFARFARSCSHWSARFTMSGSYWSARLALSCSHWFLMRFLSCPDWSARFAPIRDLVGSQAGDKSNPIPYEGMRDADSIVAFIRDNASPPVAAAA